MEELYFYPVEDRLGALPVSLGQLVSAVHGSSLQLSAPAMVPEASLGPLRPMLWQGETMGELILPGSSLIGE